MAVYLALPVEREPDVVAGVTPPGGSVLELGCGAGRVTHALVARGFDLVGVDDSEAMLAEIHGAETVLADVYDVDLDRRFDTVLAASHLIDVPDPSRRAALLEVCRRHVTDGGAVLIERYDPDWAADPRPAGARRGAVELAFEPLEIGAGWFRGRVTYTLGDRRWIQEFTAASVTDEALASEAEAAGLRLVRWLDGDRTWAHLVPS